MAKEQLKLSNQLCFPLYAASRLVTRQYQPFLDELGITYPQYLVLLVLWEEEGITVNEICHRLFLSTNTVTPLIQRMEKLGLLDRTRDSVDRRKMVVTLTPNGRALEEKAACIPQQLVDSVGRSDLSPEEVVQLKQTLNKLLVILDGSVEQ